VSSDPSQKQEFSIFSDSPDTHDIHHHKGSYRDAQENKKQYLDPHRHCNFAKHHGDTF